MEEAEEVSVVVDTKLVSFLRYFMANRQVDENTAIATYQTIFETESAAEFEENVEKLNEMTDDCKLKLQRCVCEVTGRSCYVLKSTYYRPDAMLPSRYNDTELEFIKNVVHEIVASDFGVISTMDCLNLDTKLTKTAAENLVNELIRDKWLSEPKRGKVVLSALAINELKPYLEANYKTILEHCIFCKRAVYFGELCPSCKGKGHKFCADKYAKSMKKNFKCPSCGKDWTQNQFRIFEDTMDCDEVQD